MVSIASSASSRISSMSLIANALSSSMRQRHSIPAVGNREIALISFARATSDPERRRNISPCRLMNTDRETRAVEPHCGQRRDELLITSHSLHQYA